MACRARRTGSVLLTLDPRARGTLRRPYRGSAHPQGQPRAHGPYHVRLAYPGKVAALGGVQQHRAATGFALTRGAAWSSHSARSCLLPEGVLAEDVPAGFAALSAPYTFLALIICAEH